MSCGVGVFGLSGLSGLPGLPGLPGPSGPSGLSALVPQDAEAFLARVLDRTRILGASYADVRAVSRARREVKTRNGEVEDIGSSRSQGIGLRVLVNGAWGFAALPIPAGPEPGADAHGGGCADDNDSREAGEDWPGARGLAALSDRDVQALAETAVRVARASALCRETAVDIGPPSPARGSFLARARIDPMGVPLTDQIEELLDADRRMRAVDGVRLARGAIGCMTEHKLFASSEGSFTAQSLLSVWGGIAAIASDGSDVQGRSYPGPVDSTASARGYEHIQELQLAANATRCAEEAVALVKAPPCPSGELDVIIAPNQLALQIHESCGHPTELDRALGSEASFAGTSFLVPEELGRLRYGSEAVTLVADATTPGGVGTFGWDDEGVPAQRVVLVERGLFRSFMTSRETAGRIGATSNGCMRADGWNRIPIVRMTNINLEPGDWDVNEMIRTTKRGLLLDGIKAWSIDDKRLNFQFGTEIAFEVRDGALGPIVKNPTYTGSTPSFWGSCDAVAGRSQWRMVGVTNCGKGEPMQVMQVGHGCAPARFRSVKVGVGRW